jgi:hypothetical protein
MLLRFIAWASSAWWYWLLSKARKSRRTTKAALCGKGLDQLQFPQARECHPWLNLGYPGRGDDDSTRRCPSRL